MRTQTVEEALPLRAGTREALPFNAEDVIAFVRRSKAAGRSVGQIMKDLKDAGITGRETAGLREIVEKIK